MESDCVPATTWKDNTLTSSIYNDIYFSKESGLEETKHVFLQGNNLQSRWENLSHDFCIVELGFGTGLNFFASLALWDKCAHKTKLHYITVERHPLSIEDISRAISNWPQFATYLNSFSKQYQVSHNSDVRSLEFNNGRVRLDIYFGDANLVLPGLNTQANAWFLDGFAPAKNPDMWNDNIYKNMQRLTAPGGTFATFTAAGNVRRGLGQYGFTVHKATGFGQKRHILVGYKTYLTLLP